MDAYTKFKHWVPSNFGLIKRNEFSYFSSEIKKTNRTFPPGSKVLEIGFGNGSFLSFSKNQKWLTYGIEDNISLVKLGLKKGFNVAHNNSLKSLQKNHYDLIVAFDVLEHIPEKLLPSFFKDINRILKDKGCFIARFPNGDSPFSMAYQNGDPTHINSIGSGKAKFFAIQSGLDIISIHGESEPLIGVNFKLLIHRVFSIPIKFMINTFINLIFFPGQKVFFTSPNLVIICKSFK